MSKLKQVPSVGRVVHYVLGDEAGLRRGEVRPAIVVAMRHPETPNLQLLSDGPNDFPGILNGTEHRKDRSAIEHRKDRSAIGGSRREQSGRRGTLTGSP